MKILKGFHKDLVGSLKILQRFSPGMYHNKSKNIESARRIGTFFRCFGSHFGNLARHFKVGNSNVIYWSVHVNTLVIKSAVHCLQLCKIIMIICETLFDHFRLSTSLSTWYNFTPGLYFLLPLEAIIIYTIFTSYRSRHVVYATTPSGMLRRTLSNTTVRGYGTNEITRINCNVFFLSYWTISLCHFKLN